MPLGLTCLLVLASLTGCAAPGAPLFEGIVRRGVERDLARALEQLERHDDEAASAAFRSALQRDPTCAAAHAGLAAITLQRGDLEAAEGHYRSAVKAAPEKAEYALGLADCAARSATTSLNRRRELRTAILAYRLALSLEPRSVPATLGLAGCYRMAGDLDRAIRTLGDAERTSPSSPQVHAALAAAYREGEQLQSASEEYKAALKLDPDNPTLHNGCGAMYAALSRRSGPGRVLARERAIAHYRRSLALDPSQPAVREALSELVPAPIPAAVTAIPDENP